ncbi:MAG: hypothetical protein QOE70_5664 [Chthoniobacter sp.]|jgi:outer membrane receptor protein involved in Fe transport|nr:hypothetical protein [Chthoniobacter sp.]
MTFPPPKVLRYPSPRLDAVRTLLVGGIPAACAVILPLHLRAETGRAVAATPEVAPQQLGRLSIEELMQLEVATVTTASKKEEKATASPGTVIVIDNNDIRLRGYSSLKDVLRDLPGMDVANNFFSEIGSQVSVRGITGNNKIVVLVNGMRVNPPGGEYFPFRNDFSVREAEQIEVIYGPGSTLYGQDAISAVINVKTKQPPASGKMAVELGGDGGLHNERELWGSFGKVFDSARNILFNGYVQYHDSDLMRLDREYPQYWNGFKKVAEPKGSGTVPDRWDYGLNGFAKLEIGSFSIQSWYRNSERSSAEGYGPAVLAFVPQARWQDTSWVTEARYDWKITDKVKFDSSVTYNWYEVDPVSRYVFPQSEREWFFNDYKYASGHSLSVEETLHVDFSSSLSALLGGTYTNYDIIPKSTIPGGARPGGHNDILKQGGSFVYYTQPGNPASLQLVPRVVDSEFSRYGAYLEFSWKIAPKLKVIAGGRVDKDTRIDEPSYTPRGAIIYDVTDSLTAKYTYSWAYISPAPYFDATYDRGDVLATSNPGLQPETSKTHEVSLTYNKEAFNLGLSLYYGDQSNLILVSDGAFPANILLDPVFVDLAGTSPRKLVNSVNSGMSRNAGLDFYGKAKLTRNLSTWFSYSYTTYEETTGGLVSGLKGLSQHNFRLGATWAITPQLFFTPSLVARSTPRNVDPGTLGDELRNPWEANLHLLYTPTNYLEIYADLRNFTNNHYALTQFTPTASPQETISGVIGARLSF